MFFFAHLFFFLVGNPGSPNFSSTSVHIYQLVLLRHEEEASEEKSPISGFHRE